MKRYNHIKIDNDMIIRGKLKYISFAKSLIFLADELKNSFVYAKDLSKFLRVTEIRARQILGEFEKLGLIYKKVQSSLVVEWHGVKNDNELVLEKYIPLAIETLKKAGMWEE